MYKIGIPPRANVSIFPYIAYDVRDVSIGNFENINAVLRSSHGNLDAVVGVGYGTQKKAEVTELEVRANLDDFRGSSAASIADFYSEQYLY